MLDLNSYVCATCNQRYPISSLDWRCSCGGLFDLESWPVFDPGAIDSDQLSQWRYRRLLPMDSSWEPVTLGEGNTPLLRVEWQSRPVLFKVESMCPTGSFKDRGASVLVTALRGVGVRRVVEDSSGNAGASLAAYTARAGIECEICVPNTITGPKLAQMDFHGAEVIEIKGRREYAALAAWAASAHGALYASHVFNPFFLAGIETLAYELWEQLDRRAPAAVVLPVGNGTLLLGIHQGFARLRQAGLIERQPRLVAVQAEACSPIAQAFRDGLDAVQSVTVAPTVASGIAIAKPVRGAQILSAIRASGGTVLSISEQEIGDTRNELARRGFYVEGTSAVAVAALAHLPPGTADTGEDDQMVVLLTGHGLKIDPRQ
jgi:threonine synthase